MEMEEPAVKFPVEGLGEYMHPPCVEFGIEKTEKMSAVLNFITFAVDCSVLLSYFTLQPTPAGRFFSEKAVVQLAENRTEIEEPAVMGLVEFTEGVKVQFPMIMLAMLRSLRV
jgi:hypothetical protein